MTTLFQLFVASLVFILLIFGILNLSIKDNKFTCNRYILNTYLYIILTLNIVALLLLSLEYLNIEFRPPLLVFLAIFLVSIGCIILLHYIDSEQIILKHLVWLLLILLIGLVFYPMYSQFKERKHIILMAIATTLCLFIGLSIIAYIKPEWISLSWGPVLLILLLGGIIMELFTYFFYRNNRNKISNVIKGFAYFFIIVFMFFILYDTKRLQINALECVKADYIKESLGLFLDIFNIFVRILGLSR